MIKWQKIIFLFGILIILFLILISGVHLVTWNTNLNDSLVAYYSADDISGDGKDSVFFDNNFTVFNGSVGRGAVGLVGRAYNFTGGNYTSNAGGPNGCPCDGDEFIETYDIEGMNHTQGTISVWFNLTDAVLPDKMSTLWGFFDLNSSNSTFLSIFIDSRDIEREIIINLSVDGIEQWSIRTSADYTDAIPRHVWTNFLLTHNGENASFFINGTRPSSYTLSGIDQTAWIKALSDGTNATDVFTIGATRGGNGTGDNFTFAIFNGSIDEIAIWNVSLTRDQITALYDNMTQDVNRTFYLIGTDPTIDLVNPAEGEFRDSSTVRFNYTVTDATQTAQGCELWINSSGTFEKNLTDNSITEDINQSFSLLVSSNEVSEGKYEWNVLCNSTQINGAVGDAFASANLTFTVDTLFPTPINITEINTTASSQTVQFNHTASDTNIQACVYFVIQAEASSVDVENTTITCNSNNTQFVVASFNTFNLTLYVNDSAGNLNSTTTQFTVTSGGPPGGGGGGGGGAVAAGQIPVIGLQGIEGGNFSYNDLDRMILYASINSRCSEAITGKPLATIDFSDTCLLTQEDLQIIKQRLDDFDVDTSLTDLAKFFENYKNRLLFQGFTTQARITQFGLFPSVLGLTTLLQINPPSIDTFKVVFEPSLGNGTIPITLISNKPLKSCEVISETPALTCIIQNSTIKVEYFIDNTDFTTRTFIGTLLMTSDAPSNEIEQRRVPITLRVINTGNPKLTTGAIIVAGGLALFFFTRIRKRNLAKQLKEFLNV